MTVPRLRDVFPAVYETRLEMRKNGHSEPEIAAATERLVRHYWAPFVTPLEEWPEWMLSPKCGYCDGTGLVLRFNVLNRLGHSVTDGKPCRCVKGVRFLPKQHNPDDYTSAGKVQKPMTRMNGR